MGYYINPKDQSKEDWLQRHGIPVSRDEMDLVNNWKGDGAVVPVCWVDNGGFTAAGIAYDPNEVKAFRHEDGRPKVWFLVSREDLKPWYP